MPTESQEASTTVRLRPIQLEYHQSKAIYRGLVGGRSSGKSVAGIVDTILRTAGKAGRNFMVADPTSIMMRDDTFPKFEARAKDMGIWESVKLTPYPDVRLATGATIRFRTAEDPNKMRGPDLSGIWLNEASFMSEDAFKISIACLREGGEQGWLGATFTPNGQYHWTYETFATDRPDTAIFRTTTYTNPYNPPDFAETLAQQYTPLFARQELGGEFLDIEGAYWPSSWFPEEHMFDDWPRSDTIRFRAMAIDSSLGRRRGGKDGDYAAIVFFASDNHGTIWVDADIQRRPITDTISDGLEDAKRWMRETKGVIDGFGVESDLFQVLVANEFRRLSAQMGMVLPVYEIYTNGVEKHQRIMRLTPYLSGGHFRWRNTPSMQLLMRQLREFPVGQYDDGPDALEMAIRMAAEIWNGADR